MSNTMGFLTTQLSIFAIQLEKCRFHLLIRDTLARKRECLSTENIFLIHTQTASDLIIFSLPLES